MANRDESEALVEQVQAAVAKNQPVDIQGSGSKPFGRDVSGSIVQQDPSAVSVSTLKHAGIVNYEPTELVVTVRAGTPLRELITALRSEGQMLPFEPPLMNNAYLPGGTIGGVIACGLSGPRRPWAGSARDYILGTRIINGQGQMLSFGGEVMKNVAGYDVSRLQVGAFGTLGLLMDLSMKVLPSPELEITLLHEIEQANDLSSLIALARQPLPLSASMLVGRQRYVRLSGSAVAVEATARQLGGTHVSDTDAPWQGVRDLTHEFFTDERPLWRLSVADHAPQMDLPGDWLLDWGGAQRWLKTEAPAEQIFKAATLTAGHATRYSPVVGNEPVFQPLCGAMQRLQLRIRESFDPEHLLNRGHFHPELEQAA
ncbi:MAG: glycolate oxidase subunit GlcE [Granulosicoccus sp.]